MFHFVFAACHYLLEYSERSMAGAFPVLRIAGILAIGGFSLSFVSAGAMRIVTTLAESKRVIYPFSSLF